MRKRGLVKKAIYRNPPGSARIFYRLGNVIYRAVAQDEKRVDHFHANDENLFAVYTTTTTNGKVDGSYSASMYLYSLKPVRILKDVIRFTKGGLWFRQGLTVFQFTMSIVPLIATIVISQKPGRRLAQRIVVIYRWRKK